MPIISCGVIDYSQILGLESALLKYLMELDKFPFYPNYPGDCGGSKEVLCSGLPR